MILLAWGVSNISLAQTSIASKSKSSTKIAANSQSRKKKIKAKVSIQKPPEKYVIAYKGPIGKRNISKPTTAQKALQVRENINRAKGYFKSGFLLQAYSILDTYKNAPEMDTESHFYLGECLRSTGAGITTNYSAAMDAYQKSLLLSTSTETMLTMGQLYLLGGHSLSRDVVKAQSYFQKATDNGNKVAKYELGRLYFQGLADSLRNEPKGVALLEDSANQGVSEAQWLLGTIYAKGTENIKKDMPKAKIWFKKYHTQNQSNDKF